MAEEKKVSRRGFLSVAVSAVVAGVVAGVGSYYAGLLSAPPGAIRTTTVTTPGPGVPTTTTVTGPATTVTRPAVTTTVTAPPVTTTTTVTATKPPPPPRNEIVLGCSADLTGPGGLLGKDLERLYGYAVEKINKELEGIYVKEYGKHLPVRLIIYDDKTVADECAKNIERLVLVDKIDILLGGGAEEMALVWTAASEKHNILTVGGATPSRWYFQQGYKYLFSVFILQYPKTLAFFEWVRTLPSDIRPRTIALWCEKAMESEELYETYTKHAEEYGLKVVLKEEYVRLMKDFTPLIVKTKALNPDIVNILAVPPDFITIMNQCKESAYYPKLFHVEKATDIGELPPDLTNYATLATHWTEELPYAQEMLKDYIKRYNERPTIFAPCDVADIEVLAQAIERAGTLDKDEIAKVLRTSTFSTVLGPIKFNPDGSVNLKYYLCQWRDGEKKIVWPKEYATTEIVYPAPGWK